MKVFGRKAVYTFIVCALMVQVLLAGVFTVEPTETPQESTAATTEESATASYVQNQMSIVGNTELNYNVPKSIYTGKVVTIEAMDVYVSADATSAVAGRLEKHGIAQVVEQAGEWVKITSGNLNGYVKCEALCFDEEAEALAAGKAELICTVNKDNVNVYASSDMGAAVITTLAKDSRVKLDNIVGGYYTVTLSDGSKGCVFKNDILVNYGLAVGKTSAEIAAAEEAAAKKAAEEAAAKKAAAEKAAAAANSYNQLLISHTITGKATTMNAPMTVSEEEVWLLACVIDWESNWECYEGKLAVANVILNRVRSPRYGNSITEVVRAPYQFSGTTDNKGNWSERFKQRLAEGPRNPDNMRAARAALAGVNNIGSYCGFRQWKNFDVRVYGNNFSIIGCHVFH